VEAGRQFLGGIAGEAEDGFMLVLLGGGLAHAQDSADMTRYGSAVLDRAYMNPIAERRDKEGRLHWERQAFPTPPGSLCAVKDPSGYVIEFSHG
jgi:hypothetical protein